MTNRAWPAYLRNRTPPSKTAPPAGPPSSLREARRAVQTATKPRAPHGANRDRGAAAVEMALVTPLLLLMLFGIIDFGRMLHAQITLTEAAREGARAAALGQPAKPRVTALTTPLGAVDTDPSGCVGAGPTDDAVVTLTYEFRPITPLGPIMTLVGGTETGAVTLTAKGVMPCLG